MVKIVAFIGQVLLALGFIGMLFIFKADSILLTIVSALAMISGGFLWWACDEE